MNYELALDLKNAGFPQDGGSSYQWTDKESNLGKPVRKPSLEELIEACGEYFNQLGKGKGYWRASSTKIRQNPPRQYYPEKATGFTPEEAVARLFILLHNKDNA